MRILLIEDNKQTALTIKEELQKHYVIETTSTGEEGAYHAQFNEYDLIIIDFSLPDIDGITICERIRKEGLTIPILMLTGQHDVDMKVMALDSGIDDYLTKPFHFKELLARIRALLRRKGDVLYANTTLSLDDLALDLAKKIVTRSGKIIPLRRKEFYLLEYFLRNVGRIITREMILDHIWESSNDSIANIVDVHIKYLRDSIDKPFDKKLIKTVYGIGYKIEG